MEYLTYGSVCSGIEAASVAWEPLGWRPAWFAEIEPFPCSVLAHHWPHVANLGDMTTIAARVRSGEIEAPDILVGGTPCQAFSVAGARAGLSDPRGQLTLAYVDLADAIDSARALLGKQPVVTVWENVPGVLSSKDNAFGCFLGALAGESCELQPPGGKWRDAGCVYGPARAIAWRVLDAQYFGVAQRRRRVFVVASARDGFDPAAVLFEREGVRRDTAPSRETREGASGSAGAGPAGGSDADHTIAQQLICMEHGQGGAEIARERSPTLTCNHEAPIVVHGTQDPDIRLDQAHTLGRNSGQENAVLAFSCKDYGADAGEIAPTLRAMGHGESHANAGGQVAIAVIQNATRGKDQNGLGVVGGEEPMYTLDQASQHAVCVTGEITHTLRAEGFDASEDGTGRGQPIVAMAVSENQRAELRLTDYVRSVTCSGGKPGQGYPAALHGSAVRRLTPVECERLQGFPDGHTDVLHRGKPAADGPRYKAIGNSKAVPVVRWIGRRIDAAITRQ